ncbi:MAG: asparagine synthase [Prevotellaceae bacterium]|jgi:asparagine synthetase B (glutamine-hydrolysing)|nr:asparagine synthase [Prevotellaceae bacterium]
MLYGKLSILQKGHTYPGGDAPDSTFENEGLYLLFYGTLLNRDQLKAAANESNAVVAARVYQENSYNGFTKLDGQFTIIYFTPSEAGIVRDHHGTHNPVYYTADGAFADSLALLRKQSGLPEQTDRRALSCFLQGGLLPYSHSTHQGVFRLEAGEAAVYTEANRKACSIRLFAADYERTPIVEVNPNIEAYARQYGKLHAAAIRRRIGNHRRVGILLSGGYDSGSNLAALRSIYDGRIDSYSIGFKGDNWTELPLARIMSKHFNTNHHEYEIDGSEIIALPAIIDYLGEPFVEGGLMVNYCAMRMIAEDRPAVILGGDGSDQYFGTTGREAAMLYLAVRNGMLPFMKGAFRLVDRAAYDKDGRAFRIRFHLDKLLNILAADRFGFPDFRMRELLQHPETDFFTEKRPKPDTRSFAHLYAQHAMYSDLDISINRVILYKASRMAKMFDNNLTYPYMDLSLYRFLQQLPVGLKCKGDSTLEIAKGHGTAKFLLKNYYKPLLPTEITSKKKQGGFAPMPLFFRDPQQRARLKAFILASSITQEFLDRNAVEQFLNRYDQEVANENGWFWYRQNRALQYFNLLTLTVWWEQTVEGNKVSLE